MSRSSSYTYNPETGKWTQSTDNSSNNDTKEETNITETSDTEGDNLTSTTSDKDSSTGSVEKTSNSIEINTLSGELKFIATENTIKLKAGDTVKLQGLGKYLSGDYYVKEITRSIGSNGYEHSATVIKTDFGSHLKVSSTTTGDSGGSSNEEKSVPSTPTSDSATRTYTVVKGDSLWKIAKQYYGDGSKYNTIYDANTDKVVNPDLIYVGQVLVIP